VELIPGEEIEYIELSEDVVRIRLKNGQEICIEPDYDYELVRYLDPKKISDADVPAFLCLHIYRRGK